MSLLKDDPERQKIKEVSGNIYWGNLKKGCSLRHACCWNETCVRHLYLIAACLHICLLSKLSPFNPVTGTACAETERQNVISQWKAG